MRKLLSTGFYFGLAPIVPGTFGTLPAVACFLLIRFFGVGDWLVALLALAACAAAVPLAPWAEKHFQREDPRPFVLDEIAGYFFTVLYVGGVPCWQVAVAGFFVFRVLDVLKPFPIRRLEKLRDGWGVLLDDVLAGIYGNILLRIGIWWWLRRMA